MPLDEQLSIIEDYYRRGGPGARGSLVGACLGRCPRPTLLLWVKGHADAASACAARRAAPKQGGQTLLPKQLEAALAAFIYLQWQSGLTLTPEQVIAIATIEAMKAGCAFKVRFGAAVILGLRADKPRAPRRRIRPLSRLPTGIDASAGTMPYLGGATRLAKRAVRPR